MTDQPAPSTPAVATANVKQKSKGLNPVWFVPVIALLVGGWMVFKSALNENTQIVVTFKDATGIEAGKTPVKLRDIEVGKVTAVDISNDLATISVTMEFPNIPADRFTDKTRFWIIKPRVGLGGVSGLDTLLSGAYIEADPGEVSGGKPAKEFVGLEHPEIYQLGNPGTHYRLKSVTLGSLGRESPIKYRDVSVGQVTRHQLAEDNSSVKIDIFIRAPYDKLVKKDTRFWNISGFKADVGAEGVSLDMDSIATLIAGGIAFSTSDPATGSQAAAKSEFLLHKTEKENIEEEPELLAFNVPFKLLFERGVKGLQVGAPAQFKGIRIGTVAKVSMEYAEDKESLRTYAIVKIEPGRLPLDDDFGDESDAERTTKLHGFFEAMADRGMRAQLQTGSFLTGQSMVVFDVFPNAAPKQVKYEDGLAVFPTRPETLGDILTKVESTVISLNEILAKVDAIPITEIGNDLAQTMDQINSIPFTEIGKNLGATTAKLEALPYGQIIKDMDETLASLDALIESLNVAKGGALGMQALNALNEITKAASALRGMANYLERHPEALLRGKKGP